MNDVAIKLEEMMKDLHTSNVMRKWCSYDFITISDTVNGTAVHEMRNITPHDTKEIVGHLNAAMLALGIERTLEFGIPVGHDLASEFYRRWANGDYDALYDDDILDCIAQTALFDYVPYGHEE